jgi:hypothetical protein
MSHGSIEYDVQTRMNYPAASPSSTPESRQSANGHGRPSNASGQQELSPFVHQHPASFEKVCAPIGSLDSVGDTVRQRLVRDLLGHIRAFRHQSVKVVRNPWYPRWQPLAEDYVK